MSPGISVIICCFNSEQRIKPTLEHLRAQTGMENISWEIILVNNASTDNTVTKALEIWEHLQNNMNPDLHVVDEPSPGLSNARKTGIYEASFEILCFCDDDNWLHPNYLSTAYEIMTNNGSIGALAGKGIAISDIQLPDWFAQYQTCYACGTLAEKSGDVTGNKWIWGAGMILRTAYMKRLFEAGFSNINEDRKGENLSSGGDTEICYWHILTGKKLWYDERLVFSHYISPARLTKEMAERLWNELDKSYNSLAPYFPLIFPGPRPQGNKLSLFTQALFHIIQRKDGTQLYMQLRPMFDWRLNKKTRDIVDTVKNFKRKEIHQL